MGILNLTPDSFYDGGCYTGLDGALRHAERMLAEGVDLIDVGGESTRPGAAVVSEEEELARVVPVVEALVGRLGPIISVDTSKSRVARECLAAGAHFVNDISGLSFDAEMAQVVAAAGAGLFLMHTPARPDRMQQQTGYDDLLGEVVAFLRRAMDQAEAAGVPHAKLAVDPGIGFGKDVTGNLELLRRLSELRCLGVPILLGTSRKSFIGRILDQQDPEQRLAGTLATVALGVSRGAMLHRVHDVAAARQTALMAWAVCRDPVVF
ncbi:dihydropteroate synthase [Geothermobacter hydrogeniphilus]|uniref:Dihydropteroate synthase n=2 Tax=Geothermobacter hydrogeniphilus TaxID=1969733 RepID=A0A2K2HE56_9BACT|nr:dihydropteroate synthase [Geothermobacter hydrogeniphilus]